MAKHTSLSKDPIFHEWITPFQYTGTLSSDVPDPKAIGPSPDLRF